MSGWNSSASALKKYRIGSSKEADIKRMYNEKEAEKLTTIAPVQPAQPPVLPIAGILSPLDSTSIHGGLIIEPNWVGQK